MNYGWCVILGVVVYSTRRWANPPRSSGQGHPSVRFLVRFPVAGARPTERSGEKLANNIVETLFLLWTLEILLESRALERYLHDGVLFLCACGNTGRTSTWHFGCRAQGGEQVTLWRFCSVCENYKNDHSNFLCFLCWFNRLTLIILSNLAMRDTNVVEVRTARPSEAGLKFSTVCSVRWGYELIRLNFCARWRSDVNMLTRLHCEKRARRLCFLFIQPNTKRHATRRRQRTMQYFF